MSAVKKVTALVALAGIAYASRSLWRQLAYDNKQVKASGYPRRRIGGLNRFDWRGDSEEVIYPNRGNLRPGRHQMPKPIGGTSGAPWARRCSSSLASMPRR